MTGQIILYQRGDEPCLEKHGQSGLVEVMGEREIQPYSVSQTVPGVFTDDLHHRAPTVCQEPCWAVHMHDCKCKALLYTKS